MQSCALQLCKNDSSQGTIRQRGNMTQQFWGENDRIVFSQGCQGFILHLKPAGDVGFEDKITRIHGNLYTEDTNQLIALVIELETQIVREGHFAPIPESILENGELIQIDG